MGKVAVNKWVLVTLISLFSMGLLRAATDTVVFADPHQEQRYHALIQELRCVVCQNQTLADSHAPLAKDLRTEVERLVKSGQDEGAIVDFLVSRYGDFVLYRPRLQVSTLLLWFGPALFLILAVVVVRQVTRRRVEEAVALTPEEQQRLQALTQDKQVL